MSHEVSVLMVAVTILASGCSNSGTESRSDGATASSGGAGGISSIPSSSGGSRAADPSSSSAGSAGATATTSGASTSSGGSSARTGGTGENSRTGGATASGGGGTGGKSTTGGTTASIPNTSIDASVEEDAGPDAPVLAQCLNDSGYPVFKVCTDDRSSFEGTPHYMGRVIAVETFSPDAGSQTVPCGISSETIGAPQGFTLALQDGGTVKIVYGSIADIILPSLAAWKGQTVTVDVWPYSNGGYFASGYLLVSDSKGLVLVGAYSMGSTFTSQAVGSTGITVSAGAVVCQGNCRHLKREIVFAGTTAISLFSEKQGSFKVGSLSFTGLSLGCSERQPDSNCADGWSWASWAIWRDAP
jgi:hypothetical protein